MFDHIHRSLILFFLASCVTFGPPGSLGAVNGLGEPAAAAPEAAPGSSSPSKVGRKRADSEVGKIPPETYGLPQFILKYPDAAAHKDVFQIIFYSIEHHSFSAGDKEKMALLLRTFVKVW